MRPYRAFAIAFVFGFVLLWIVIPDRFYYLFGIYPVLFASGAIVADEVATGTRGFFRACARHRWLWRSRTWAIGIVLVNGITFLPLGLPVLPASVVASANLQKVNYNLGEEIGWPELVREVARVWRSLPPSKRREAVVVTDNYGEAGAITRFGASYALPTAYSGHNSFWSWGPPAPSRGTTIAIGIDRRELLPYFERVQLAARIHNHAHVNNDEAGSPIWICSRQRQPWPAIWVHFKHYG
jgi:hypothetical protein